MVTLYKLLDRHNPTWRDVNGQFHLRAEELREKIAHDEDTNISDTSRKAELQPQDLRVLEATRTTDGTRLTCELTLEAGQKINLAPYAAGWEALILSGTLKLPLALTGNAKLAASADLDCKGRHRHPSPCIEGTAGSGYYIRQPANENSALSTLSAVSSCRLLLKTGEMATQDQRQRCIDTGQNGDWLPGPVAGTQVMPLHMQDERSVLLIRWTAATYFKPQLDPQGEELFVVSGTLHDALGSYQAGSWIRNPIPSWQSWGGHPGTVVYYKNGHFP